MRSAPGASRPTFCTPVYVPGARLALIVGAAGSLAIVLDTPVTSPPGGASDRVAGSVPSAGPSVCARVNRGVNPPAPTSAGAVLDALPSDSVTVPPVASWAATPPSVRATSPALGAPASASRLIDLRLL